MCVLGFIYRVHQDFPLVFLSNRDEFYDRPSQSARPWVEFPQLLAGRDIQEGGTWLGITKKGRFCSITNYRDMNMAHLNSRSRGQIVLDYLVGGETPPEFINRMIQDGEVFNGFNLIFGTVESLYYYSSISQKLIALRSGIYGLCNHLLDTPWPKVTRLKKGLNRLVKGTNSDLLQRSLSLLSDQFQFDDTLLPDTGIGIEYERLLSSIFIRGDFYGTRATTVILVHKTGNVLFYETSYDSKMDCGNNQDFEFNYKKDHSFRNNRVQ